MKLADVVVMNGFVHEITDDDWDGNPELVEPPVGLFKSVCTVTSMLGSEAFCTYEVRIGFKKLLARHFNGISITHFSPFLDLCPNPGKFWERRSYCSRSGVR